ncbi:MAG: 4a-hydroxytetrahydrobiopterin dehydratase [Acidimicrobiia bacterium]
MGSPSPLSDDEVRSALTGLPGWGLEGAVAKEQSIVKEFTFPNFVEAIAFINRLADRAEEANHHPDLENHYNRVKVGLRTYSAGGITQADLALAAEIEAAASGPASA